MPLPTPLLSETPASHEVQLAVEPTGSDFRLELQLADDNGNGLNCTGCSVEAWAHSLDGTRCLQLDAQWVNAATGQFHVTFDRQLVDDLLPDDAGERARRVDLGGYSVAIADSVNRVIVLHGPLVGVRR